MQLDDSANLTTMKPISIFIVLTIVLTYFSCQKNDVLEDNSFEAEVLGRNPDCGIFAVRFNSNLDKVSEIVGATSSYAIYIAQNLPVELQSPGLTIILEIRKPNPSEVTPCTAQGPAYPWIYVTSAKLKI